MAEQVVTWGSFRGATYEHLLETNPGWCAWTREKHRANPLPKTQDFCNWLDARLREEDSATVKGPINVSVLAKVTARSPSFRKLLGVIQPQRHDLPSKVHWERPTQVPPNLHGVFVDYVLRHYLASRSGTPFSDFRADLGAVDVEERGGACFSGSGPPARVVKAYTAAKASSDTRKVLADLFYTSTAHTAFWGEGYYENIAFDPSFLPLPAFESLAEYLDTLATRDPLLLNPGVGNRQLKVCGDADVIAGDELVDFKVSKNCPTEAHFHQLFLYTALHYINTGHRVTSLTVLNPLLQAYWTVDVSRWEGTASVVDWVRKKVA